eukprot:m.14316 g.14316  ORF g.14316 m.14316 type:complete len:466 (+) comp7716_c0_seq1:48-1445(+)
MVKLWVGGTGRLSVPAIADMIQKYGNVVSVIKKGYYSFIEMEDGALWEDAVRDLHEVDVDGETVSVERCSSENSENSNWPPTAIISVFVKAVGEDAVNHVNTIVGDGVKHLDAQYENYSRFAAETETEASALVAKIKSNVGADVKAFVGAYTRRRPIEMPLPFSIKLSVRPHFVGAIIGHGGENIQAINTKSHANVEVSKHIDTQSERSVTIKGSLSKTTLAFSEIVRIMSENDDNPSLNLYVPYEYVGQLIGKQGNTIKFILERSGAKVEIHQSHLPPELQPFNTVTIAGTQHEMSTAFSMMAKKFATSYSRNLQEQYNFEPTMSYSKVRIHFPSDLASVIIGKGGSSVRAINNQTGTTVSVLAQNEDSEDDVRICEIRGAHLGVVAALSEILSKLKTSGCSHFTLSFEASSSVIEFVGEKQLSLERDSMSQISVVSEDGTTRIYISGGLSSVKVGYGLVHQNS